MATVQHFRTALAGFNRQDVVNYIEFLNNQHNYLYLNMLNMYLNLLRNMCLNILYILNLIYKCHNLVNMIHIYLMMSNNILLNILHMYLLKHHMYLYILVCCILCKLH